VATRESLLALRAAGRARLPTRLARATQAIDLHLHAEGLGCRLDAPALQAPDDDSLEAWRAELLRLVAAALATPRRLDPRARVLAELQARLAHDGALQLPASPSPLLVLARRGALHFPEEPLLGADGGSRALMALLSLPRPI
jgi:hypothetical protein